MIQKTPKLPLKKVVAEKGEAEKRGLLELDSVANQGSLEKSTSREVKALLSDSSRCHLQKMKSILNHRMK